MKTPINILYICHDRVKIAGAALSLLNLLESLDGTCYKPIVLVRKGVVRDLFTNHGYECISFPYQLTLARKTNIIKRKIRLMLDNLVNNLCVLYLAYKFKNNKISIVHSNSTATDIGFYIAKKLKAKHVWHLREFLNLDFNTSPSKGWDDLYGKIYRSDYVIAITQKIYAHWKLYNCSNAKIIFDAVRSKKDITYQPQKEKFIIFCAATLGDGKGADVAIKLFCLSELSTSGYRLKMIGSYTEDYKRKLDTIAAKYHQQDYIDYLGFKNDIAAYFVRASAFLMCSVSEALGRVTIEAFFYGCPVLGHNSGGTSELLKDGETGYLYDSEEEGARKLKLIIEKPQETQLIVQQAIKYAEQTFTTEVYGDKICNIYEYLLDNKKEII